MNNSIRLFLKSITPNFILNLRMQYQVIKWKIKGKPAPPPHFIKRVAIKTLQKEFGYTILVETGTLYGDMVEAQLNNFEKIISIELNKSLCERAKNKFKNNKKVEIIEGDSGVVLNDLAKRLNAPAIFWLDGHYSGGITSKSSKDCPIYEEISGIMSNNNFDNIFLIDDAVDFNGKNDYPTIEELKTFVSNLNPRYRYKVVNNMIYCFF